MIQKDSRIKLVNEVLNGMKVCKPFLTQKGLFLLV